jgi:iron(III) transport system substrate-binding protein
LFGLFTAIALVACGGDSKDDTLTVYSGRSETLVGPIIDQFIKETGVDVRVKYGKTSELVATLLEEGDKTPADIFFAQDPAGLGAVESKFTVLANDIPSSVPGWARPPSGKWVGISGRARVVVYNTDAVDEDDLPDGLEGFLDPEWSGRIGWAPTNGSFQAMVTAMRHVWGEERTRSWLEGIQANNPKVYPKNTPTVAAAGSGEIHVGFVNHYYLHRFLAEEGDSFKARNYYPRGGGPGGTMLVAGVGILDASNNKGLATQFVRYLLSAKAQQYFSRETFEHPLVEGIVPVRGLLSVEDISAPRIDLSDLDDLVETQNMLRAVGVIP